MITVIRIASLGLFYYRENPVTGGLGRPGQNHLFIAACRPQDWFSPSPERYEKPFQDENCRVIADLRTPGFIQIPIVLRHTETPCLRPAVSSLGACPTPAL